ncbi:anthranilate phosphoribosyltransferase [Miltoncostaea marina]|uniref:anthranilate phosphoribosyltransferase n=1 Tax=Miltoncostaea marina TaxID=2843215 RepID=UPI0031BAB61D
MISRAIDRMLDGEDLGREGASEALDAILSGEAGDAQTAAFLIALRAKGETAEELAGLAATVRARAERVAPPSGAFIDTCGTGGGRPTFNISTTSTFVVAGAGVAVAKHGNRSATSKCGSADVLEALGARIDLGPDEVARCLDETGLGFMFAPSHHPAFRHIVPVRRALGVRTIFNLLGPLTNPAGAPRQLLGVSDAAYLERMGQALAVLGCERALLVRGRDGMDEVSSAAVTDVVAVDDGEVRRSTIDPAALGVTAPADGELAGGDPAHNAEVLRGVLGGRRGPARDVVVLNAAAAIWLAGVADGLEPAMALAEASIDEGAARDRLDAFVAATRRLGAAA